MPLSKISPFVFLVILSVIIPKFAFQRLVFISQLFDEFRLLIRAVNAEVFIPARADVRAMRLNVIGSTQGRPELAKAIREIQEKSIRDLADAAKPAAERGWIPEESLFLAIAAWHQSSVFGYGMLEVGGSVPEELDWKHVYLKALEIMIFGDYLES